MSDNFFWALFGLGSSVVLMIFELLFLTRWLRLREERSEKQKWEPFRALFLTTIVRHLDELNDIGNRYVAENGSHLAAIRAAGRLTPEALRSLVAQVAEVRQALGRTKQEFYFGIQTAAPSLKPEAAALCGEAFYFCHVLERQLEKAAALTARLSALAELDGDAVERPLSELDAIGKLLKMILDMRFSKAKADFVQYVWKQEQLHYYEPERSFCSPREYKIHLETEKDIAKLKAIPRETPIKRFFDPE